MILQTAFLLAVEAAAEVAEGPEGGLFDLNATLPLMALQTVVLVAILNKVFYEPFSKTIDDRNDYCRSTRLSAKEQLSQAKQLSQEYEQTLSATRKQAQVIFLEAQAEAQRLAAEQLAEAQREAQQQRNTAQAEIAEQRYAALQSLEQEVDGLSRQILEKLIGAA
ncbi:F0F1 ATP synthase subunit B' [Prochlorothrix hollandica]|uniref:ATP synthase subunit b' n=1 Tax=Prochlorothrix hollandica PCC 9006 = CALU 1027 TaxID=317619 RepID=A0A0M2PRN4_PROHO|nr:F0F1 ATP synthase subunit B' [Prochlorothrix hollandica]KKI98819.1 ATP synthase F0F1 subunit B' [Prochlorothrix hollandica PCC 9006 = CALU 1027]